MVGPPGALFGDEEGEVGPVPGQPKPRFKKEEENEGEGDGESVVEQRPPPRGFCCSGFRRARGQLGLSGVRERALVLPRLLPKINIRSLCEN